MYDLPPTQMYTCRCNPEETRGMAVSRALQVSKDRGFDSIVAESDCLSLISRLLSEEGLLNELGAILDSIREQSNDFGRPMSSELVMLQLILLQLIFVSLDAEFILFKIK
ncbi:conserved hypothetical protein [Ricinus communis]|uniref:RNase H type-1 domain-containing protein n=1 Tax=Ricinus communis TaxID=3988 RepID=B9SIM1_RICCO|nr:conserved hypothetical protein [Ricinus communis]